MKSPKCEIFKNVFLLLIFTTSVFGSVKRIPGLKKEAERVPIIKKEIYNVEEWLEDCVTCYWHIMCDMNKPLKLKEAVDALDDRILLYTLGIFGRKLPPRLHNMLSMEKMRNDTFWVEDMQPELCSYPDEERKKFARECQPDFIIYGQEICTNLTTTDLCKNVRDAEEIYNLVQYEMAKAGECSIRHQNTDL